VHILPALLVALPTAAAFGGWALLPGLVVAGLLAAMFGGSEPRRAVPHPLLRAVVLTLLAAVAARAFGMVVLPDHDWLAGLVVAALVSMAAIAGLDIPTMSRRAVSVVLLLAAAGFAAVCAGVEPPPAVVPRSADEAPIMGWIVAAGLFAAPMLMLEPGRRLVRVGSAVLVAGAVAAGALYQLGPQRLGLSDAPLHDTLIAAGADTLTTMLAAVVVLGTLPAALIAQSAATRAAASLPRARALTAAFCLLALLAASTVEPIIVLAAASTVAVTSTVLGWAQSRRVDTGQSRGQY